MPPPPQAQQRGTFEPPGRAASTTPMRSRWALRRRPPSHGPRRLTALPSAGLQHFGHRSGNRHFLALPTGPVLISTMPSTRRLPTTTIVGTPSSSESLNFTPVRPCDRRARTRRPASSMPGPVLRGTENGRVQVATMLHIRRATSRPDQTLVVVVLFGDCGHCPGHPDAV